MKIELYTWTTCPFCVRAKAFLAEKGLEYTEHVMDSKPTELAEAKKKYGHPTVPIVVIDDLLVGGYTELTVALR